MGFVDVVTGAGGILLDPYLWLLLLIGTFYGIAAGAMPGIGVTLAFGLVLPFTFVLEPAYAIAFLLAIAVASAYGNAIPAVLLGVPGTPAAVLTVMDGFKIHKRGDTGLALGISLYASVFGQVVSIPFLIFAVVPLSGLAFSFLPPELFAMYLLGMIAVISLTGKNVLKGLIAGAFGILVGVVGIDPVQFRPRFDFGVLELREGFAVAPVIVGLLAVSELLRSSRQVYRWDAVVDEFVMKLPRWSAIRSAVPAVLTGTTIGTLVGAIPGASGTSAAMISYQQAQFLSKRPEDFGEGSIEGLAANEAAQNSANTGELIPTLGLGIPGSGSMVLLLGALTIHGLIPGPMMVRETPDLLFAAVAGLMGGAIAVAVLGWVVARVMLRLVTLDRSIVIVVALTLVVVGVYSLNSSMFDVYTTLGFGVIGYAMMRYGYSTAAAALAVILAGGFEKTLRQGLALFQNDVSRFVGRPITASLLVVSALILSYGIYQDVKSRKRVKARREQLATEQMHEAQQSADVTRARPPDEPTP